MRKAIPKQTREKVKTRFNGRCGYCGELPDKLQIDHIVPVRNHHRIDSDENDEKNLMPACFSCNNYKFTRSLEEFRHDLSEQIGRARRSSLNFRLAEKFGQLQITKNPIVFYFEKDVP